MELLAYNWEKHLWKIRDKAYYIYFSTGNWIYWLVSRIVIFVFLMTSALIRIFALVQQASGPEYTQEIKESLPDKTILKYMPYSIDRMFICEKQTYQEDSISGHTLVWIPLTGCKANNESPCISVKPQLPWSSTAVWPWPQSLVSEILSFLICETKNMHTS